jgi:putative phosphoribosyl transferase
MRFVGRREAGRQLAAQISGVIVVDDGLATGSTMLATILALRKLGPARVVVAVRVAPADTRDEVAAQADEIVCLDTPEPFYGVGQFYEDFSQIGDQEARSLLHAAEEWVLLASRETWP